MGWGHPALPPGCPRAPGSRALSRLAGTPRLAPQLSVLPQNPTFGGSSPRYNDKRGGKMGWGRGCIPFCIPTAPLQGSSDPTRLPLPLYRPHFHPPPNPSPTSHRSLAQHSLGAPPAGKFLGWEPNKWGRELPNRLSPLCQPCPSPSWVLAAPSCPPHAQSGEGAPQIIPPASPWGIQGCPPPPTLPQFPQLRAGLDPKIPSAPHNPTWGTPKLWTPPVPPPGVQSCSPGCCGTPGVPRVSPAARSAQLWPGAVGGTRRALLASCASPGPAARCRLLWVCTGSPQTLNRHPKRVLSPHPKCCGSCPSWIPKCPGFGHCGSSSIPDPFPSLLFNPIAHNGIKLGKKMGIFTLCDPMGEPQNPTQSSAQANAARLQKKTKNFLATGSHPAPCPIGLGQPPKPFYIAPSSTRDILLLVSPPGRRPRVLQRAARPRSSAPTPSRGHFWVQIRDFQPSA